MGAFGPGGVAGGVAGLPAVVVPVIVVSVGELSKLATVADGVPGPKPATLVNLTGAGLDAVCIG